MNQILVAAQIFPALCQTQAMQYRIYSFPNRLMKMIKICYLLSFGKTAVVFVIVFTPEFLPPPATNPLPAIHSRISIRGLASLFTFHPTSLAYRSPFNGKRYGNGGRVESFLLNSPPPAFPTTLVSLLKLMLRSSVIAREWSGGDNVRKEFFLN